MKRLLTVVLFSAFLFVLALLSALPAAKAENVSPGAAAPSSASVPVNAGTVVTVTCNNAGSTLVQAANAATHAVTVQNNGLVPALCGFSSAVTGTGPFAVMLARATASGGDGGSMSASGYTGPIYCGCTTGQQAATTTVHVGAY